MKVCIYHYLKYKFGENIFRIRKSKIKENIEKESYVEEIQIQRELPGTVKIITTERTPEYMIEKNGMYIYIDKNGYALEENSNSLELTILKGLTTNIDNLKVGERISDEDLSKFNDLIKINDSIKNNNIEQRLSKIDISDDKNYILEFEEEKKKVLLGEASDLSTKMLWIKYFIEQRKNAQGIISLNTDDVFFTEGEFEK